jgi:branched-chain amino acid transport system substrate-binding protein
MYGWGAMNPTAIKEAVKAKFPMDKFISIWWTNDNDVAAAGEGGKGFLEVMLNGSGADYPAFAQIKKLVIDAGKSQTPAGEFGQVLYDRGVYNAVLTAEAIANAQKISGKKVVTGEEVRRGLESINLDPARLKTLGLEGFASPFKLTCADHNSHGATFVEQWDGAKWVKITSLISSASDKVQPLLDEAAKAYTEKNAGWPARTEACDNKS